MKLVVFFIATLLASFSPASALFIDRPEILSQLESQGFDFARLVLREETPVTGNEALVKKNQNYLQFVQSIAADLEELKKADPKLSITMKSTHRLFDPQWLTSNEASYELVGIVNRVDRLSFQRSTCGELRFIYRLAYKTLGSPATYSRLPMTINAVFWIPRTQQDCSQAVGQWSSFIENTRTANLQNQKSTDLPLGELKSIEVNLQSVRWPSTVRPDMGGYAEYLLRAFQRRNGRLVAAKLENTPDVPKLESNPKLKAELLVWLSESSNLKEIDKGIALIPDKFLAHKATSVALHGVHRLKNAPFSNLFAQKDFKNIEWHSYESIKSSHGLMKRLNDLSCVGCHQGRTVAGFHFLGKDKAQTDAVNSIAISASPHFLLDQERRNQFFSQIKNKQAPTHQRPVSVRAHAREGRMGSHCGLGDPSFAAWTCEKGYRCEAVVQEDLVSPTGVCVPEQPIAGSPCELGVMAHSKDSWKDKMKLRDTSCGARDVCEGTRVGFPNGMCSGACDNLKPGETCGSIANLFGFNQCLSKGADGFAKCLSDNVRPGALQACDESRFCRDDYICARTSSGKGACIPPYFLFQLRVDGHPSPGLKSEKFTIFDRLKQLLPDGPSKLD